MIEISRIAALIGAEWHGDPTASVGRVAPLDTAGSGDMSFLADRRHRALGSKSRAGAIVVEQSLADAVPPDRALVVRDVRAAVWRALDLLGPEEPPAPGIHPSAIVSSDAEVDPAARIESLASIGDRSIIGARAVIGAGARVCTGVSLGEDARVGPNAVLLDGVRIGARARVGPGTVIGGAGFGFASVDGTARRMPHTGTVVVEDDVEIGANCTIDRAMLGETRIGRGSKLDSLVHVGHNVTIGPGVIIAAQTGISGSVEIGAGTLVGGQAGFSDHVTVAPGSRIAAKAGVMKSGSGALAGHPARPLAAQRRAEATLFALAPLVRTVRDLARRIARLESARDGNR